MLFVQVGHLAGEQRLRFLLIAAAQGRDEFVVSDFKELVRRGEGGFQQRLAQLALRKVFFPELVPCVEILLERVELRSQRVRRGWIRRVIQHLNRQIRFEDVLRGRQDIGQKILPLSELVIDRPVDLYLVERAQRHRAEQEHADGVQRRQAIQLATNSHVSEPTHDWRLPNKK